MQGLIRASKASNDISVGFQYKKNQDIPFPFNNNEEEKECPIYFFKHRYSAVIRSADGTKPQFTKSWNSIP